MHRTLRLIAAGLCLIWGLTPTVLHAAPGTPRGFHKHPRQETGFLNRRIQVGPFSYRYQVYVPEDWQPNDHKQWPVILFLHGRGERGSEGMWQTQIGLPQAIRDHPERWPFIVVMAQCSLERYWTDREMLAMAMAELDAETAEFHGDSARTYLAGLSMGGYGAWELARQYPHRWASIAIAAGGIFWSYAPDRWQQASILPGEYAQAIGRTPVWLFHGADDNVVAPRQVTGEPQFIDTPLWGQVPHSSIHKALSVRLVPVHYKFRISIAAQLVQVHANPLSVRINSKLQHSIH